MDEYISGRLSVLETNNKNIFHQLDELKDEVKNIRQLTVAVKELALSSKATAQKVADISDRLSSVEHAPAEDMKHYKRALITALLTGIIGIVIGTLGAFILK